MPAAWKSRRIKLQARPGRQESRQNPVQEGRQHRLLAAGERASNKQAAPRPLPSEGGQEVEPQRGRSERPISHSSTARAH